LSFGIPSAARKEDIPDLRKDLLGPVIRQHIPVVPDGSRANLLAAFDKRCNYFTNKRCPPDILDANAKLLDRLSPAGEQPLVYDRALFESWNSQFASAKQARHLKAFNKISDATLRDFSDKEIFVKVEALLKRHDPNWAPRIIYQSSDLHNVLLGPVMWQCCKRMFAALQKDSSSPVTRLGAYKQQTPAIVTHLSTGDCSDSVFLESDFSSNDMTQVQDVHMLEVLWLERFGAPKWLTALMLVANSFRVSSRKHKVKATVKNQLPTGAQSTTFRNSMWNLTINYRFCELVNARGAVCVLGDDMVMRLRLGGHYRRPRDYRRCYENVCKRAHMIAVVKSHSFLEECSFLSKHFVPTANGYVMVPFLGKAAARFNVRASSNEAVSDRAYLCGKSLSYAYEFRFCTGVRNAFLKRFKQLYVAGEDVSLDSLGWNAKGAFLELGFDGVVEAIANPGVCGDRSDFNRFWHTHYSLTYSDVMHLLDKLLFGTDNIDVEATGYLSRDWL
jgi:hypothetical protein